MLLAEQVGGGHAARHHRPSRGRHARRSASASRRRSPSCASATRSRSPRPGRERPLTKPDHFRRFLGRRARVRTREPRDGHRSFTGELVGATERGGHDRRRRRRRRDPVRRHPPFEPRRGVAVMSREIVEAMRALAREKGISPDQLMAALEDALLSAYKKQPGSAKYARVEMDPETGDFRVFELLVPERLEAQLIVETIDEGTVPRSRDRRVRRARGARDRPGEVRALPRPDRRARRHARRLRPHRRADRQAGDPAADPRGRARHDVRGVPRPRRRADHRHRPAVRLALHARPAARARRGAAAQVRAGRRRALRPRPAHQGRHQGGLASSQGPVDHRLAAATRS